MKHLLARIAFGFCVFAVTAGGFKTALAWNYGGSHTLSGGLQADYSFGSLRFFPQYDFADGFSLKNWSASLSPVPWWSLSAGNVYLGGIFSRFNNPVLYAPGALKSFGARQTGIAVSQPSFSSGEVKTISALNTLKFGPVWIFAGGRLQKEGAVGQLRDFSFPFFGGAEYSFLFNRGKRRSSALRITVSVLAGHTVLKAAEERSWFFTSPYFAPTGAHYALAELTLKNSRFEFFSSNGFMEHPLGGPYFFTRNEVSARFRYFLINGAFSLIDAGYLGGGGNTLRQSVFAYLNPQTAFALNKEGTVKLNFGFLAAVQYRVSSDKKATPSLTADFKAAAAFSSRPVLAKTEYRISGCDAFERFLPLKETPQIIQFSVLYRTAAVKPVFLAEASVKHESYPFFYGTPDSVKKTLWTAGLRSEFRPLNDLKFEVSGSGLFKKSGNEYEATAAACYIVTTAKTKSEITADFSFAGKQSSKRIKIGCGLKYELKIN